MLVSVNNRLKFEIVHYLSCHPIFTISESCNTKIITYTLPRSDRWSTLPCALAKSDHGCVEQNNKFLLHCQISHVLKFVTILRQWKSRDSGLALLAAQRASTVS